MNADRGAGPTPDVVARLIGILKPFNKTGSQLTSATRFSEDLNFDSLVVMEFVAAVEDAFDISVPLNILPEIATVGDLADAIDKILAEDRG
jgi:acyl carrier protein